MSRVTLRDEVYSDGYLLQIFVHDLIPGDYVGVVCAPEKTQYPPMYFQPDNNSKVIILGLGMQSYKIIVQVNMRAIAIVTINYKTKTVRFAPVEDV